MADRMEAFTGEVLREMMQTPLSGEEAGTPTESKRRRTVTVRRQSEEMISSDVKTKKARGPGRPKKEQSNLKEEEMPPENETPEISAESINPEISDLAAKLAKRILQMSPKGLSLVSALTPSKLTSSANLNVVSPSRLLSASQ